MENTIYEFRKELENLGYNKRIVRGYPRTVRFFLAFAKEIPEKITVEHIKSYHSYLQKRPCKNKKGALSENSIYCHLGAVKIYFNYLQRTGQIKANPYVLKLKTPVHQARSVLSQRQIQALYKNCTSLEQTIIIHLCYGCGLRRTEAQDLNVGDVHLDKKLLYVRMGKGRKRRVIPLTQGIATDFKKYIAKRNKQQKTKEAPFLINNNDSRMLGYTIYQHFKSLVKTIGKQSNISLHNLRHSIATHLLENKMSVEMIRDFLGHSQLSTTQVYTRINLFKNEQSKS